jgi:hypothetical protein
MVFNHPIKRSALHSVYRDFHIFRSGYKSLHGTPLNAALRHHHLMHSSTIGLYDLIHRVATEDRLGFIAGHYCTPF